MRDAEINFIVSSISLSICCVRRISQYLMTSATPNVKKNQCLTVIFEWESWERKRGRECDAMRFHERDYIRANMCAWLESVNELAITGILFRMKVKWQLNRQIFCWMFIWSLGDQYGLFLCYSCAITIAILLCC